MIRAGAVVLTELRTQDSAALRRWINDARTTRFNAPWRPVAPSAHEAWFESVGRDPAKVALAIRAAPDGPALGVVQLLDIHPVHRSAQLTIRIGDEADRGKGYGVDALTGALDFAWRDLNLRRVWLHVFADNDRAIRAYARAGFVREGLLRGSAWIDGAWRDEIVMAVLRPDPPRQT
jgi:RimJ/RimL family protein N-acetyltransferase